MNFLLEVDLNSVAIASLPNIGSARFPVVYERARDALAECSSIDECQQWADKAMALASYARQADDETLKNLAIRIQARAIRRCGELLKRIPEARGANQNIHDGGGTKVLTRTDAASDAGLSERQKVTALRVASVPADDFERQIESATPPTVTALAEQGKQARPLLDLEGISPDAFRKATEAGALLRALAEFARNNNAEMIASGFKEHECAAVRAHIATIDPWVDRLVVNLSR